MLLSTLAISGVPIFSGFLSKDGILAGTLSYYNMHQGWTIILPISGFGAAMITAFYMFRLIFKTFYGKPKIKEIFNHIHESPLFMIIPLIILSLLSFAFVFTFNINPLDAKGWFKYFIHDNSFNHVAGLDMYYINKGIKKAHDSAMYISLFVATIGIVISILFYYFRKVNVDNITKLFNIIGLYNLSKNKFYIDTIYSTVIYKPFMKISKISSIIDWDIYDQKIIDAWGWITLRISSLSGKADYNILDQKIVDGISHITNFTSRKLRKTQSGVLQNYLLAGFGGLVIIIIFIQQIK